jgi:hypothetical protein
MCIVAESFAISMLIEHPCQKLTDHHRKACGRGAASQQIVRLIRGREKSELLDQIGHLPRRFGADYPSI